MLAGLTILCALLSGAAGAEAGAEEETIGAEAAARKRKMEENPKDLRMEWLKEKQKR